MLVQNRARPAVASSTTRSKPRQLSSYSNAPELEIDLDRFESLALGRLNVLRWIEKQRGLQKPILEPANQQRSSNQKYLPDILKENNLAGIENDEISHFIVRMGFSQTEERRRWFLSQELTLFEARYQMASHDDRLRLHGELCPAVSNYEVYSKERLIRDALTGREPIPNYSVQYEMPFERRELPYHKVPFSEVFSLVQRRRVYLQNGWAFIPNHYFSTLITGKFRAHLSRGLAKARRAITAMKSDPDTMSEVQRIMYIIEGLHKMSSGPTYKSTCIAGEIKPQHIEGLSRVHFPLCMQNSYDHLKKDKHAKHGQRMQFSLFLKGIGLGLPDALSFWKAHMTTKANDFQKQYAYNLRHNYGKEGKRTDYSPYGCNKIISAAPNQQDYHGCPYRLFDKHNLQKYLVGKQVPYPEIQAILKLKESGHYQLACRKYWEIQNKSALQKHKMTIDDIESTWSHPNEYFDLSYELHNPQIVQEREAKLRQMQTADGSVKIHRRRSRLRLPGQSTPGSGYSSQVSPMMSRSTSGNISRVTGMEMNELENMFSQDFKMPETDENNANSGNIQNGPPKLAAPTQSIKVEQTRSIPVNPEKMEVDED